MVDWAHERPQLQDPTQITGFADAVNGRASVRRYAPGPVPREDVTAMVGVAVRAANAGNAQTWRFVAVEDPGVRAAMKQAVDDVLDEMGAWPETAGLEKELKAYRAYATFFAEAPVVIAVFSQTYHSLADELHERRGLPRDQRDRLPPAARHAEPRRGRPAALQRRARHGVRLAAG